MTRPTCTRRLEIDAGHRLMRHESKCRNAHGHRYVFDVTVSAQQLDAVGRVVDFSQVKALGGGWLDEHWDHGFIVQDGDPLAAALRDDGTKIYVMQVPPTAENLCAYLANVAECLLRPMGLQVDAVRVYETPNCWADWSR